MAQDDASMEDDTTVVDASKISRLKEIRSELRKEQLASEPTHMSFTGRSKVVEKEDLLLMEAD